MNEFKLEKNIKNSSRREFIKRSSIATVGLALASNKVFMSPSQSNKLRIGIVGLHFNSMSILIVLLRQ